MFGKKKRSKKPVRPLVFSKKLNFTSNFPSVAKKSHNKYEELYKRELEEYIAQTALNERMNLLKTKQGKIAYLGEVIKESEKKGSIKRNISRRMGAKYEKNKKSRFMGEIARIGERNPKGVVSRSVDKLARWEKEKLESTIKPKIKKTSNIKKRSQREKLNSRYFSKLFYNQPFIDKTPTEKIEYLQKLREKDRNPTTIDLIRNEIQKQKNILLREEAKKTVIKKVNSNVLINQAMQTTNPNLRKKILTQVKNILVKEGKQVPIELRYIEKYGKLSKVEIEKAKEFEKAKINGDHSLAAKSLKGAKFKVEEMYAYSNSLIKSGQGIKAGMFFIELGFANEAEKVAKTLERKGDRKSLIDAMNIRKMNNN
jgi:hypothetical protein